MRSRPPFALSLAAAAGLVFLLAPLALIFLYAFTTDERSYTFPPPGLTTKWFAVAWGRQDVWNALGLSVRVAALATGLALILGTLCAAAAALKQRGAAKVVAYCTHPVLSGPAIANIQNSAMDELVVTDTIPLSEAAKGCGRIRQLSVAELLAETMRRISFGESVSSLYID